MPVTVVKCSVPNCQSRAESKIAAPWKGGRFTELKTYGYACAEHSGDVIEYARKRPKPLHLPTEESLGALGTYALAGQ